MSPRVQLVFYPDGDGAFASHASVGLQIDLPSEYSADEVISAVQEHLRQRYPLAAIRALPVTDGDEFDATWRVYRDALPPAQGGEPAQRRADPARVARPEGFEPPTY
jgi:hypothetical protein